MRSARTKIPKRGAIFPCFAIAASIAVMGIRSAVGADFVTHTDAFDAETFDSDNYRIEVIKGNPTSTIANSSDKLEFSMSASQSGNELGIFTPAYTIDPGELGAVKSIKISFLGSVLNGSSSVRALVEQDGKYVWKGGGAIDRRENVRISHTFTEADGIDLSDSAGPISVGFRLQASRATFTVNYRIDDFVVEASFPPGSGTDKPFMLGDFEYSQTNGIANVTLFGEARTLYVIKSSDDCETFETVPVQLLSATSGTLSGDTIILSHEGEASFSMNLGISGTKFVRAETP